MNISLIVTLPQRHQPPHVSLLGVVVTNDAKFEFECPVVSEEFGLKSSQIQNRLLRCQCICKI